MDNHQRGIMRIIGMTVLCVLWAAMCYFFKGATAFNVMVGSIAGWQMGQWFYDFVTWLYPHDDEEEEYDDE